MQKFTALLLILILSVTLKAQITIDSTNIVSTCLDCDSIVNPPNPYGSLYIAVSGGVPPFNFSLTGAHAANTTPVTATTTTGVTNYTQLCQDTFLLRVSNASGDTIYYNFSTTPPTPPNFNIDSVTARADSTNSPDSGFMELHVTTNADSVFYKIQEQNNSFTLGTLGGWQDSTIFDSLPGGYSYKVFVDIYPKVGSCGNIDTGSSVMLIYIPLACENDGFALISAPTDVCFGDVVNMFGVNNPGSGTGNVITGEFWDFGDGNNYVGPSPTYTYFQTGSFTIMYNITTSHGCTFFGFSPITVHTIPIANFTNSNNGTGAFVFTDVSTSSTSLTSWLWDFGDGNTSTMQNPSHQYASTGSYNVCLTVNNAGGCTNSYCDSVTYTSTIGINEQNASSLSIFPNPVNDILTIENVAFNIDEIIILDITGKTIKTVLPTNNKINVSALADGVYFIKIISNNQQLTTKFIKN
ncbi:MAG: PKD domain-containing protein [Flavobacteriales bacterium]|nr:PKD domain-containing protein [Flavobacteriales bacterium]MCW8913265.1 PKD domain-containing protein [Flavobacteriales bacterium]MCW8938955.1 PKD domain-containing protein [Flavobacteriales bacterium]MCW8939418.1 PKD domain-containing protein [Flavobacteriales bacterium]MCW8991025.1 PKD domain-containing protein [Flavobacteriales bacterium]